MVDDYKPNSNRFKEEQKAQVPAEKKKVEKVISGTVKTRKKSGIDKVRDVFISDDAQNIKSYVVMDVLVPAIKKAISDIVTDGIAMLLYGDTNRGRRSSSNYVSYDRISSRNGRDDRRDNYRTRSGYDFDDVVLETRGEAEEVLDRMDELIKTYGVVSVADMYDLIGKSCNYTDNKYGWTNIRNAEPVRVRDGYLLKLPKALPID